MTMLIFVLLGYVSGSILYARVFAKQMGKGDIYERSRDRNPGAANAFVYGGFWCGTLTLAFDILKGFLPVALYLAYCQRVGESPEGLAFVLAAPVLGHNYPLFYRGKGGKGISTSFGCLLGLLPMWRPVVMLAAFFIFFSLILRVTSHYHRTWMTYICTAVGMLCFVDSAAVRLGFVIIAAAVCSRLMLSREEREKLEVKLLWMH